MGINGSVFSPLIRVSFFSFVFIPIISTTDLTFITVNRLESRCRALSRLRSLKAEGSIWLMVFLDNVKWRRLVMLAKSFLLTAGKNTKEELRERETSPGTVCVCIVLTCLHLQTVQTVWYCQQQRLCCCCYISRGVCLDLKLTLTWVIWVNKATPWDTAEHFPGIFECSHIFGICSA